MLTPENLPMEQRFAFERYSRLINEAHPDQVRTLYTDLLLLYLHQVAITNQLIKGKLNNGNPL